MAGAESGALRGRRLGLWALIVVTSANVLVGVGDIVNTELSLVLHRPLIERVAALRGGDTETGVLALLGAPTTTVIGGEPPMARCRVGGPSAKRLVYAQDSVSGVVAVDSGGRVVGSWVLLGQDVILRRPRRDGP